MIWLVALTLTTSVAGAQAPARDTSAAATGEAIIRGRVVLAGTDQSLGRVDVRASSPALKVPRAVKTDADGRYEIAQLPASRYVVRAVKANFVTASFGQRCSAMVFSQDPEQWTAVSRFQGAGRTDQNGRYRISGLPPGRYCVDCAGMH